MGCMSVSVESKVVDKEGRKKTKHVLNQGVAQKGQSTSKWIYQT